MADNVQGFNHLDEVLMSLGQQFRQDAIKKAMIDAQLMKAVTPRPGSGTDHSTDHLKAMVNQLQNKKEEGIKEILAQSKDVTGVETKGRADAEAEWMKENPGLNNQLNEAMNAYNIKVKGENKGAFSVKPTPVPGETNGPQNTPVTFGFGGGLPDIGLH